MLAAGAAIADQHRLAHRMTALDRDATDRVGHPLEGDAAGPLGQRFRRDGRAARRFGADARRQRLEGLAHHGGIRWLIAAGAEHRGERSGRQPAEQQVGVGERQRSAEPIAGWSGHRPG